ncbi:MAG: minor capsid protein, partial [Deltaproteobacteria bacterium]|nr:minor capsid protein [Deltaproteobacteria bacterium]
FDSPFSDAVKYAQLKGFALSPDSWRDLWQKSHAHAFTVARVTAMDVVRDIKGYVDQALAQGTTLRQFQKDLKPRLQEAGWWAEPGEKPAITLPDGEVRKRLTMSRLGTIYDTNINVATAVGRWKQFQDTATTRPYVEYDGVDDGRTRPAHRALHSKVFRLDDPGLAMIAPPNGFRCRCFLSSLTDREVQARGLKVEDASKYAGAPDEGWDYNPGAAGFESWKPELTKYDPELVGQYEAGIDVPNTPAPPVKSSPISPELSAKIKTLEKQIVDKLGVKNVDFADNYPIAKYVKDTIVDAVNRGFELPANIIVSDIQFKSHQSWPAAYRNSDDTLIFNPNNRIWRDIRGETEQCHDQNLFSTGRYEHIIWHELAHKKQNSLIGPLGQLAKQGLTQEERDILRAEISRYAAVDPVEAVAEILTGMMSGKIYSPEIMDIYKKYQGPKWPLK